MGPGSAPAGSGSGSSSLWCLPRLQPRPPCGGQGPRLQDATSTALQEEAKGETADTKSFICALSLGETFISEALKSGLLGVMRVAGPVLQRPSGAHEPPPPGDVRCRRWVAGDFHPTSHLKPVNTRTAVGPGV